MRTESLRIKEVLRFTPALSADERGLSFELWQSPDFVKANVSLLTPWALGGIYHSKTADRLVHCLRGTLAVVAVDLRPDSATYLLNVISQIDETTRQAILVPPGFGYGFLAIGSGATMLIERSSLDEDVTIRWNDPDLSISWPLMKNMQVQNPILTQRDRAAPLLRDI